MQKRKICALFTGLSILVGSVTGISVGAFGGSYPEHPVTNPPIKEQESSKKDCWTESDPNYLFTVGGKNFLLLDTDDEGNYFVLADEEYGKYPYSKSEYGKAVTIETRMDDGGNVSYVKGPAYDMEYDKWKFDTQVTTSIGYWLNNDFLENGNGSDYKLPEEIKAHLVETDWPVEGYKPVISWTATQNYENVNGVTHAQDFADSQYQDGYTTRGKVALMSYTEYMYYQELIGWMYCSAGWDGFMLRTPHSLITASDSKTLTYKFGSVQVRNQSTNVDTSKKMLIAGNDAPSDASFYVRPVMWLDKDFFASVAVDIDSAGTIVKDEIKKRSLGELSLIYSDEQLASLGFDLDNAPKTDNQSIAGTPVDGAVLYAKYDYSSLPNTAESNSEIEWYISDSADGEYTSLGLTGKSINVDDSMVGKYIKYRIMPVDKNNVTGKYYWSEPTAGVQAMEIPVVSDINVTDSNMTLTLKNLNKNDENVKIIKAVFSPDNELLSVSGTDSIPVTAGGESVQEVDISEKSSGNKITVMVWVENSQPVFYMNF